MVLNILGENFFFFDILAEKKIEKNISLLDCLEPFFLIQNLMLIILFARRNLPKSFPEELEAVEKVEFFDIFSFFELIFY